jgi:uncharacterized protein with PQ loop repeat
MNTDSTLLIEISGWIPAIVFPVATLLQLIKIVQKNDARSISKTGWFLFGVANIGLYFYAEKYFALQSIIGFLGNAFFDFLIVILAFFYGSRSLSPQK